MTRIDELRNRRRMRWTDWLPVLVIGTVTGLIGGWYGSYSDNQVLGAVVGALIGLVVGGRLFLQDPTFSQSASMGDESRRSALWFQFVGDGCLLLPLMFSGVVLVARALITP